MIKRAGLEMDNKTGRFNWVGHVLRMVGIDYSKHIYWEDKKRVQVDQEETAEHNQKNSQKI